MDLIGIINYLIGFAIMAMIYAIFALGLNVHWGFTGLFNIGIAGFFALGAYTAALLTSPPPDAAQFEDFIFGGNLAQLGLLGLGFDAWFFLAIAAAAAVSGVVALIIGGLTLRLNDDYLSMATLGIAESVRLFFLNEKWAANGSKGLYRIPKFMGDLVAPENYDYLYVVVVLIILGILFVAVQRAVSSPWGRVLRAIREDEVTTAASGKNVFYFKLQSFVLGAMIMGVGGALFAHHIRFLSPLTFDPLLATFVIWAMLMVGGSGNNVGAVVGAFVVWGVWAGTQFLPGVLGDPSFRLLMIGVLIVVIMLLRPAGLLGEWRRRVDRMSDAESSGQPDTL